MANWDPWTRRAALSFLRKLEPELAKIGWHCGMIGSVLHKGSSSKDLDIVVYPRKVKNSVPEGLVSCVHAVLRQHGMTLMADRARVLKTWAKRGEGGGDEKWVEVWAIGNKRVDVFILS